MAYVANPSVPSWTAVDLVQQLGPMELRRVVGPPRLEPATVADVIRLSDHEDRLCELIDGLLLEKTHHAFESHVALRFACELRNHLDANPLGIALGADGMLQLFPNQVRIPDACFISSARLAGSGFPDDPVPEVVPDLVAEVISRSNTNEEMDRKLREYFDAGVRLVWYVYPKTRTVHVHTAADEMHSLAESDSLVGGEVLPGLTISIAKLFALPEGVPPADA